MATREAYYETIIKKFINEDLVVDFLNQPDIINKWSDEDREYFIFKYLEDNGWVDIEENEPVVTKKTRKKK
jgi:hypothetical protein